MHTVLYCAVLCMLEGIIALISVIALSLREFSWNNKLQEALCVCSPSGKEKSPQHQRTQEKQRNMLIKILVKALELTILPSV